MNNSNQDPRSIVCDTIYQAALSLDDQKWDEWLALCDNSFNYAIKSFSPEIKLRYDLSRA